MDEDRTEHQPGDIKQAKPEEKTPLEELEKALDEKKVGGYKFGDILKAPVKPPKPDTTDTVKDTSNRKVLIVFLSSILLGVLGFIFMLLEVFILSIPLFALAAVAVMIAVFAPIN